MLLVVFLLLMHFSKGDQEHSTILERIPDYLRKLCPRSNACNVNDSTFVSVDDSDYESCCTYCSCKLNCVTDGNCCFAPQVKPNDTNTKGDNISVRKEDVSVQCLYPKLKESPLRDFYEFVSYNMITSFRDKESSDRNDNCGYIKVAPWGSLYPVSSKQTGEIYKNFICARFNNITDGVSWDTIIRCNMRNTVLQQTLDIAYLFADLEIGVFPEYCNVLFFYPGDLNDIKSQVCYKDMVANCTAVEFQVPALINATKQDISEACQSGLVSPYYGSYGIYANVFCYICSGSKFYSADICAYKNKWNRNVEKFINTDTDFVALLDYDAVFKKNNFSVKKQEVPMVCPKNNNNNASNCRPLLCPSAQLRDLNSKCVFSTKAWYQKRYTVALELRSEKIIDLNDAFQWSDTERYITYTEALYLSETSGLTSWNVDTMWYKSTSLDSNRTTNTIVVYMTRHFNTSDPADIAQNISLLKNRKWLLRTKNETLVLMPSLFRLRNPLNNQQELFTSGRIQGNYSSSVEYLLYRKFYIYEYVNGNGFFVTKLYFCDQVELEIGEYVLSTDQGVLYNKFSQNFLFDGEFILKYGISDNSVRICYENSGFVHQNFASANVRATPTLLYLYFFQFLQSVYGWDL